VQPTVPPQVSFSLPHCITTTTDQLNAPSISSAVSNDSSQVSMGMPLLSSRLITYTTDSVSNDNVNVSLINCETVLNPQSESDLTIISDVHSRSSAFDLLSPATVQSQASQPQSPLSDHM